MNSLNVSSLQWRKELIRINPLILIFTTTLLLMACTRSVDYSALAPSIEPIGIVREVEGYDFYFPISMAADSGLVFIADFRDCRIRVFNENLDSLYSIGQKGQGPGEFERLLDIDAGHGVLAAFNLYPPRISLFDYRGDLINLFSVEATRWGEISVRTDDTVVLATYLQSSRNFISTFSLDGELIDTLMQHSGEAEYINPYEFRIRMQTEGDQIIALFEQVPRIIRIGDIVHDLGYDFTVPIPHYRRYYRFRLKWQRQNWRGYVMMSHFGGFTVSGNHLFAGGPNYHLMVLDLGSNELQFLQMGSFASDLFSSERQTQIKRSATLDASRVGVDASSIGSYIDVIYVGDEIWMLSTMNSCIVKFNIADILSAAEQGVVMVPQDYTEER